MDSHRIVVMADYGAFPVWHNGGSNRGVPMSAELRQALVLWAEAYDRHNLNDTWPAEQPYDRWRARGRELAIRLRDELGSDWTVEYFDWGPDPDGDEDTSTRELL